MCHTTVIVRLHELVWGWRNLQYHKRNPPIRWIFIHRTDTFRILHKIWICILILWCMVYRLPFPFVLSLLTVHISAQPAIFKSADCCDAGVCYSLWSCFLCVLRLPRIISGYVVRAKHMMLIKKSVERIVTDTAHRRHKSKTQSQICAVQQDAAI
jgi:hypothetical protein